MIEWTLLGPLALITIAVALLFDFYNGLHDAANSIATVVATRALPVWAALLLAATFNFLGAFAGTAVAAAVGKGLIDPAIVTTHVVLAALVGAIFWSALTVILGIPISSSQSLIGGLLGAALAAAGLSGIQFPSGDEMAHLGRILGWGALAGIAVALVVALAARSRLVPALFLGAWVGSAALLIYRIYDGSLVMSKLLATILFIAYSPFIGFVLAFTFSALVAWIFQKAPPAKVKHLFRYLQIGSSSFYSHGHGKNDAQKTMGVITALLVANGALETFDVPYEVIVASGLAIALGTLIGGYRIVRTMGSRLTHLDTSQGFCAETSSAIGLTFFGDHGVPVSTTHSITGAILGVGAFQRISAVSWGVARRIVSAWVITIPAAAMVAALTYVALSFVL